MKLLIELKIICTKLLPTSHKLKKCSFQLKKLSAFSLQLNKLEACNLKLVANKFTACILWLAAILILTAASCTKEEPKHRDVVTATINGKPWKAGCKESPPFGCSVADLQYYVDTGGFSLRATNIEGDTGITIVLLNVDQIGSYKIPDKQQCGIIVKEEPCGRRRHYIDSNDPQEVEILKIDQETKIIEGRFHYIGRDTVCQSEPVHITNGYFKVKYRP